MKILHLYSGNLYGGVETLLATLARCRRLSPELDQEFALCFEGRLMKELNAAGVAVHSLGGVRMSRPQTVWRARRNLRRILAERSIDIVICHSAWSHALFAREARRAGKKLVFWLHNETNGKHWIERWAGLTSPDLALCNSHFTWKMLPRLWPHAPRETLYYLVAEPIRNYSREELAATRAELETPENAIVIIQVSRMEEWKGHLLHLDALGRLRETPDWICWMVGGAQRSSEAAYLYELQEKAARLGIAERIRFLGERSDVPRLLAAADIHCQPNTGPEPFGITFIEALYARLPVVTTDLGGAREIVDPSCGVLVRPDDAWALAATLGSLLSSPNNRTDMAAGGVDRARRLCDPATQTRRLSELLAALFRRGDIA
jgi:glycosyltransferase involved in cell wall biosynthesis